MEVLGYLIIGIIEATFELLEGKSFGNGKGSSGKSWIERLPWLVKWIIALAGMIALVMIIFVIAHLILGPDAQGNSRVF